MPSLRPILALAVAAPVALALPSGAAGETPAETCARAGTDDSLRPIPASLAATARRLFGLDAPDAVVARTTVFRCAGGAVLLCNTGANLPCGRANTDRGLASAARYCRDNPDDASIPMVVTGHDTVYRWRCRGGEAEAGEPVERTDARGFVARLWKPAG